MLGLFEVFYEFPNVKHFAHPSKIYMPNNCLIIQKLGKKNIFKKGFSNT